MTPLTAGVSGVCLGMVRAVFFTGFVVVPVDLAGQREGGWEGRSVPSTTLTPQYHCVGWAGERGSRAV